MELESNTLQSTSCRKRGYRPVQEVGVGVGRLVLHFYGQPTGDCVDSWSGHVSGNLYIGEHV